MKVSCIGQSGITWIQFSYFVTLAWLNFQWIIYLNIILKYYAVFVQEILLHWVIHMFYILHISWYNSKTIIFLKNHQQPQNKSIHIDYQANKVWWIQRSTFHLKAQLTLTTNAAIVLSNEFILFTFQKKKDLPDRKLEKHCSFISHCFR